MSDLVPKLPESVLPALPTTILPVISELAVSLSIPHHVLARDEEIQYTWYDLPRELRKIPPDLCGELVAGTCVAVSTGLFDGTMNYAWNVVIPQLRIKIRSSGLSIVTQILQSSFEEKHLLELQDNRLPELAFKLNLADEDGFFFLDQCREVRSNSSAAHPTIDSINDREFTTLSNQCVRYALADAFPPKGVDIGALISAVKGPRLSANQHDVWV